MAAGELIGCFGLTEPGLWQQPERHADDREKETADGYVINGEKR